jgi:glycosyltransferase involved in cell wall biosynthesis
MEKNIISVKNQSHDDWEHIFVDGFSDDRTVEIIKEYKNKVGDRVNLVQLIPRGISNAMNEGLKLATGDFIIHLHSDDSFYDKQVLLDVNNFLLKNKVDWLYGKINVVGENGEEFGRFPKRKIWQLGGGILGRYLLIFFNFIPHQAVFIKKDVFEKVGFFDETINSAMDIDLWLRIKDKTRWVFFDKIISNYSLRVNSQSINPKNKRENVRNLDMVRKRYSNKFELIIIVLIDFLAKSRKQF